MLGKVSYKRWILRETSWGSSRLREQSVEMLMEMGYVLWGTASGQCCCITEDARRGGRYKKTGKGWRGQVRKGFEGQRHREPLGLTVGFGSQVKKMHELRKY